MQLLGVIVEERGSLYIVTEYMAKVKKMGNYSSNVLKLILLITSDLSLSRYLDDETVLFVATSKFEHAVKSRTYLF